MIDHISLAVTDYEKSKTFYSAALAPIGYSVLMEFGEAAGFGAKGKADLWVAKVPEVGAITHVAFLAENRADVDAFYRAALAAGGKDNGAPGLRPQYHENYYAAVVLDFDGHNVEVVCHKAE